MVKRLSNLYLAYSMPTCRSCIAHKLNNSFSILTSIFIWRNSCNPFENPCKVLWILKT